MNLMDSATVSTENHDKEAFVHARIISQLPILVHFMRAAVELNVFDIIAKHGNEPVSASQIAAFFPEQNVTKTPIMLDRMLSLLVSFSLLNVTKTSRDNEVQKLYTLTPSGKYFVKHNVEGSLANFLLLSSEQSDKGEAWSNLKDAITEGVGPCDKTYGLPIFQVMSHETGKLFNRAMSETSTITMRKLLENYKGFNAIRDLVDVGGGDGSCLKIIISKNPHMTGINFDLPKVVQNAPTIPGITHVGGDMFAHIPKGDAILLKNVLHNWGDEYCVRLLKLCYDAIPSNGKVIIIEAILPDMPSGNNNDAKDACLRDASMFILPGGKERTREQLINLSRESGFSNAQFISSYGTEWIMEFHK